ncbi:NAD(P)H-dependent glycerol-3-phosphate dehydrogenase [Variovorax sp. PCZ-1]|uniref:NAD(P)H-dependent glycerol-3-phosphate dehydrogenase n=1 Tax=Variovorax sp. PCZ-1 TaxID=2835533 RepID=UPI001BCA8E36|nr:NAD(P)H-dependent glycerol-3-phosphate dehydrogenase [Variovorax sp. PCZ-1]MBS7806713.1 NAD(P)-dependent glycerol-3-phosphate dehydrogenase [Variovorax sp. PCZ-1]
MKIIVIGAGAWGTALAASAARSHDVRLLARDAAQAAQMQAMRLNSRYLPDVPLPSSLAVVHGDAVQAAAIEADLFVIATPMAGLAQSLAALSGVSAPVVWLCKGFDGNGLLGHEIAAQAAPESIANRQLGVLSGPSFAQEVASGQPTALVAASSQAQVSQAMVEAFHSERLRVYENSDIVGVEVGGAVKNVLAIATGLCDGLQLGLNARAALITRGLAEMTRLGVALGAQAETFMGLSGLGDLVLTATGDLSRNRKVGLLLAQGQSLSQATASLGHVAEGARCAAAVLARAQSLGVDMPITQCVVALLAGKISAEQAVALLMGREPGREI